MVLGSRMQRHNTVLRWRMQMDATDLAVLVDGLSASKAALKYLPPMCQYLPSYTPVHAVLWRCLPSYASRIASLLCHVRYWHRLCRYESREMCRTSILGMLLRVTCYAIGLHFCYAVCGTELAYGAIDLRFCYAMCGTELVYGATRQRMMRGEPGSAARGTGIAYAAVLVNHHTVLA
eukprot:803295-Rhodomonas_salina.1